MASSPSDLRYSESHEWFRVQGNRVTIGITRFAVAELTDITYASLKPVGTAVKAGDPIGEVESVKATSDVYSAVAGKIVAINSKLDGDPSLVNTDPFGEGWLVTLECADASPLQNLMDAKAYDAKHPA